MVRDETLRLEHLVHALGAGGTSTGPDAGKRVEPEPERGAVQHGEADVQPRPNSSVQDRDHGNDGEPDSDAGKA